MWQAAIVAYSRNATDSGKLPLWGGCPRLGSRRTEAHHHAALPEVGLHGLAALAIVLGELGWIEHRFLGAFLGHCGLQRRYMDVDVGIVLAQRAVDVVDRFG